LLQNRWPPRQEFFGYLGLWLFALLLRAIYLWQIKDAPVVSLLMGDARGYDSWAQEIARGHWIGDKIFYQTPLYPYFLGLMYAVVGHHLFLVRVLQIILGATSCLFIALAGRFFFSRSIGIVAGVLLAVYPSAIYFDGLIQKPVLDLFFLSFLLFALGVLGQKPRAGWWIACGATLGLLALSRENALILVLVIVPWLLIHFRQEPAAVRSKWAGLLLTGLAIVLVPVALRNKVVGGEFHLTTSQFGPNLFIGNHEGANGMYAAMRPARGNSEFEQQDATELAETALGRKLGPAEVSTYWTTRALAYVRSDPVGWLRLMGRKWFLTWNALELPDTEDQYTYADSSPLLRGLTGLFHFGILWPLGLFGIVVTWKDRERLGVLYVTLIGYAASVALFFVFARYRFPLVAWLVLFAAAGLVRGYALFLGRQWITILAAAVLAGVAGLVANRRPLTETVCRAVTQANLALDMVKEPGRLDEAIAHARTALRLQPDLAQSHGSLGLALTMQGKLDEAIAHLREALRLKPEYADAHYYLANALAGQGKFDEAIAEYTETLRLRPDFADVHCNLGNVFVTRGQLEQAIVQYREALRTKPDLFEAQYNWAFALVRQGRSQEAIAHYAEAVRLNPNQVEALDGLARLLATDKDERARNPAKAVELARRACELTVFQDPVKLDTLAMAYAEAGRFQEAIQTASRGIDLATTARNQELADAIRSRLRLYQLGKPYHE
jgi:tetratricopeptide (TPR) repeat protein/4-amino-4-deoxy-L-arabinose transferase-like glycosyltransferase